MHLQHPVRGLRLVGLVPARVDVARGRRHHPRILRLRLRVRGPHALHDAAGCARAAPHGALRFRLGHHESFGDDDRHGVGLFERCGRLPDVLPCRDAGHGSGLCGDTVLTFYYL